MKTWIVIGIMVMVIRLIVFALFYKAINLDLPAFLRACWRKFGSLTVPLLAVMLGAGVMLWPMGANDIFYYYRCYRRRKVQSR